MNKKITDKPKQVLKDITATTTNAAPLIENKPFETGIEKPEIIVDKNKPIEPQAPIVSSIPQEGKSSEIKEVKKERNPVNGILILIIIILLLLLGLKYCGVSDGGDGGLNFGNGSASDGALALGDYNEIKAGLQSSVDDSYMNFKINLNVAVNSKTQEAKLMIQNTEGNKYSTKVDIYLSNETEDLVYTSPLIKPNQFVETDKLTTELPIGEYEALAVFTVFEEETSKTVNQIGVKLTLTVK